MSGRLVALVHRHGETELNTNNVFRARMDPPLDINGIQQAERAAEFLERYDIERIVTSPMLRAWQTAMVTSQVFGHVPVVQERALMPWDLGFMAGKDRDLYQDLLEYYVANPDKVPPDGESLAAMKFRTDRFFMQEFERDEGLTCYICSTSNIVALNNIINGNDDLKPEIGESVEPGGIVAVWDGPRGLEIEPVWGIEKQAEYGVS
jgi:phosphoserine phosphatase